MFDGAPIHTPVIRAHDIATLSKEEIKEGLSQLKPYQVEELLHSWRFWARDEQIDDFKEWTTWLFMGGRGSGKTKSGAEWVKEQVITYPGTRWALIGPTAADVRDTMLYGTSGLMSLDWPVGMQPVHIGSKRGIMWPNGSQALTFSAEKPNRLRGPNFHGSWSDEITSWRYGIEAWDLLQMALRLEYPGASFPRNYVSTTPKPIQLLRDIIKEEGTTVRVTRGSTFRNRANLSPKFFKTIVDKYKNSTLGRQEIYGELIDDLIGALWKRKWFEPCRLPFGKKPPTIISIVVGVDPASSELRTANECGIIVAGLGNDDRCYVLGDFTTHAESPDKWGKKVCKVFNMFKANYVVCEENLAGGLVKAVIKQHERNIPLKMVMAKKGKHLRAEPIAMLYEQGKVSHCGSFTQLEDQCCNFTPTYMDDNPGMSPDRVDALVYAVGSLMLESSYRGSMDWI